MKHFPKHREGSTAVLLLNFCAKNPPHRQAVNRWRQPYRLTIPKFKLTAWNLNCQTSTIKILPLSNFNMQQKTDPQEKSTNDFGFHNYLFLIEKEYKLLKYSINNKFINLWKLQTQ
jgi:hypothetical protein